MMMGFGWQTRVGERGEGGQIMTGRDEDGAPNQAEEYARELPGAEVPSVPNNDERPPRLHVIRDRLDRATVQALGAWMQKDAEDAGQIDDLAGYVLVAWNKDGRPAVYPRLFSPLNPIPAYILPSYLQTALSWWIEDGMPEDIGG